MGILDWNGWLGIALTIMALEATGLVWLWTKLDNVRREAERTAEEKAGVVMTTLQSMKNDSDKVHSDLWKAINENSREQLGQLKKQHEHELWARDHFISRDTLSSSIDGLKQVLETRMDALSEQIDAQTAAVNHLMAAQTRKGR